MTVAIHNLTDAWNDGLTTFTAIKMNVTDTASAAASLLLDLQVGGASRFKVEKAGWVTATNRFVAPFFITDATNGAGLYCRSNDAQIVMGVSDDVKLYRDAANVLAQRRATNPQEHRWWNTFTDLSNGEYGFVSWNEVANHLVVGTKAVGTGTGRDMILQSAGQVIFRSGGTTGRWTLRSDGHIYANTSNTYDIGASSGNKPRTLYLGTGIAGRSGGGAPTTTDIPASQFIVWKDTTGGGVSLYYNDAGTLKSVALV